MNDPHVDPPFGTRWIMGRRDLPQDTRSSRYRLTRPDGKVTEVTLRLRKRQIMDALMRSPIFCASPVRLSDIVLLLRHDYGVNIETEFFEDKSSPVVSRFGVYVLVDKVERVAMAAEVGETA